VQPLPKQDTTVVNIDPNIKPPEETHPPKPVEPVTPPKMTQATNVVASTVPVVRPDVEVPKNALDAGPASTPGPVTVQDPPGISDPGPAIDYKTSDPPATDVVYSPASIDFMPEPVGGAAAWNKFLSKNLRFPAMAQQDGVGGRVLLSFIIEKDGTLSHITVDQPAGHGFDEEALRVLKLAKAWTPGRQNGQPVRVKYSIPITFQAPEI
jgi:protein TonB